jgi:hypothetical protein
MIKMTDLRLTTRAALAGGILLASSAAVAAQDAAPDNRWLPWTGCWQATDAEAGLLCVQQADGGVEFLAVGDEGVISDETIVADGQTRAIEDETCDGTTTAEFSPDGERVYLREAIDCDGTREVSTGLIAMVSPSEWVDIRGSETGEAVWARTFRRVTDEFATSMGFPDANDEDDLSARMLRWRASEPSDFDDLLEVYDRTGSSVTRAWVAEQLDPFPINAEKLVELDDAGLPVEVIDIVVAHAFPDEFALARTGDAERRPSDMARASGAGIGIGYVGVDPYYRGYWSPWSYRYRGVYGAPYGYGYGGGWGYPYRDRIVIVERRDIPNSTSNGQYVRPRPGGGYSWGGGSSSGGGAQPARVSGGSGSTTRAGVSSSGGVSGGRSTGRTAKPRTSGGGAGGGLF